MNWSLDRSSNSVDETMALGRTLGAALCAGDFAALAGPLGAGKTHLIKGIAVGLGVPDERRVNSPTFVLIKEYAGRCPVYHLDAYRLGSARELEALGLEEMASRGVILLEWADRAPQCAPASALWIEMAVTGETGRRLRFRTGDDSLVRRLKDLGLDRTG